MAHWNHQQREVVDGLRSCHASIGRRQRQLLSYVVEANRHQVWHRDGCRDVAEWLSSQVGISKWVAHRWVVAAKALEGLPLLSAALESGSLCLDKVCELARFATAEDEAELIAWAKRVVVATIRARADAAVVDAVEETRRIDRTRQLDYWFSEQHFWIQGYLPADQGAVVAAALDRVADSLVDPPEDSVEGQPCGDPLAMRRADALVALASQSLASDGDADRATVVVHTSLEGLVGRGASGELETGGIVPPEVVSELACDARIELVVEDGRRGTIGIGRASRNVPRWMMRQLRYRDRTCTFPGCGSRRWLQAHHVVAWEQGGPTELDNLTLVCLFHHKLVHRYGWRVELDSAHVAQWFREDGRRYAPEPVATDDPERAPPGEPALV